MEIVRKLAVMCVARAVGFGALAIGCIMFSFAFDPPTSFKSGAILTLLMSGILLLKAQYVLYQQPRHTEVWLYLDEQMRPRDKEAVARYANVLRDVYLRFSRGTLAAACAMFAVSLLLMAAGLGVQDYQQAMLR